jgi:hypothetical protein
VTKRDSALTSSQQFQFIMVSAVRRRSGVPPEE